ncbi:proteasome assembly chaperone family protein [halophilic archaeon]|nr:proteasome assembly chaperone family protein [halophilic archaeon]
MVAGITVDQITRQLGLSHHGSIRSEAFPQVAAFANGQIRDPVRVYTGTDPDIFTLQSDFAFPPPSIPPLRDCLLHQLDVEFDRAIFLIGASAETEAQIGQVRGVATTDDLEAVLWDEGIEVAADVGFIGGVTGALANACYQAKIPTIVLIVDAHPYLPDPQAAKAVIETAVEPLVSFDIDTTPLEEQADQIQQQMEQMADHLQELSAQQSLEQFPIETGGPSMYQ